MKTILLMGCWMMALGASAQTYTGKASFYADKFHGRETASGEKYDQFALTAAHLTLPFGTVVRVTNLWNGKSVVVTVNDRGPFSKGRIIDVSKQAAIELQMITAGVVDVKVEVLEPDAVDNKSKADSAVVLAKEIVVKEVPGPATVVRGDGTFKIEVSQSNGLTGFGVQIGSFSDALAMLKKVEELNAKGFPDIYMNTAMVKGKRYYRVIVGNFERREEAELYLLSLKSKGFKGYVAPHQVKK